MKQTQVKDAARNIKKQMVSYLSIVVISMLAVLTYLGINYAARAIERNSTDFYTKTHFRDAEVLSTYLITQSDIEALRALEGVSDVEGIYRLNCKVYQEDTVTSVMAMSITSRINIPEVIEGRLPANSGECVIEREIIDDTGLSIGDTITLLSDQHTMPQFLNRCDFVITGIVRHPDHTCSRTLAPGDRYVLLSPDAFDTDEFGNNYMSAAIRFTGTDQYDIMSDDYLEYISGTLDSINTLADSRAVIRYEEIRNQYQDQINEGQSQLQDAEGQLTDARAELDLHWQEYYDGVSQLNDAEQQLTDAANQLASARAQLDEGAIQLEDARAQLASARAQLDSARDELTAGWAQLEAGRIQLEQYELQIQQGQALLDTAQAQLAAAEVRLRETQAMLDEGRAQLESGYVQIEDAKTKVRNSLRSAITAILGEDIANRIDWSESSYVIDLNDPNATATQLHISTGLTIDLNRSLGDNIFSAIASLGIPEEDLRAAYEATTGMIIEIIDGRPVLEFIVDQIVAAYNAIDSRYDEFASTAQTWDSYHDLYIAGLARYNEGQAAYDAGMTQYLAGREALNNGIAEYNAGVQQYQDGLAQYNEANARYLDGEAQYQAGLAEFNARCEEYQRAELQYEEGEAQYEQGLADYESGQQQLEEGLAALEEGESEYSDGIVRYNEGQERLQQAMDDLELLQQCHWSVLSVEGNASYLQLRTDVRNVSDMGGTFAFVFVLVGALVIYATVGRIIEEQRRLVGATKALGLYNREIFMKYLAFGSTATIFGEILGIIFGYAVIQKIYLMLYGTNYTFDVSRKALIIWLTAVVFIAGVAISSLTVWFACSHLMRSSAIELMKDTVPTFGKASGKYRSKSGKGSLYGRMILFNMLSDKKRVLVTIASIAGSCTLLVTGMSLNFSINQSIDAQFKQVEVYDLRIGYDRLISDRADKRIEAVLDRYGASYMPIRIGYNAYDANGKISAFEMIVGDLETLNGFYERHDPNSNQLITDNSDGIWVFQRLAETLNVNPGDELVLYDSNMNPHRVRVAGVFTVYVGIQVVMSPQTYEQTFDKAPNYNALLVNLNGVAPDDVVNDVSSIEGFTTAFDVEARYEHVKSVASVLNYISALFVGAAGLMAYFILLNLVNMYVHQKTPELTIMRVNGFRVKEVIRYVSIELIVCNVFGIIFGLLLGSWLSYRVLQLMESITLHFVKNIQFGAWGIAAFFTIFFSSLVGYWALRKVKDLKLTDINN